VAEKLCPLRKRRYDVDREAKEMIAERGHDEVLYRPALEWREEFQPCIKEQCAWWYAGRCAVLEIAKSAGVSYQE